MTIENILASSKCDPGKLETLYRNMQASGDETAFRQAIAKHLENHPDDTLMLAWAYRLDIQTPSPQEKPSEKISGESMVFHYKLAVVVSVLLAICYVVSSWGGQPAPAPGEANPLFWLGWSSMAGLAMLLYLAVADRSSDRSRRYAWTAMAVIVIGAFAAVQNWSKTGPVAELTALHLPFVVWAVVGIGLCAGRRDPFIQGHAFMLKSLEAVMVGGIYFGSLAVFAALTHGIFDVIGIRLAEDSFQWVVACGIGIAPVMALASVYRPEAAPSDQNLENSLANIVVVISRLILPLAMGVLLVYLLWFIPAYFERPFQDRSVLIVYNATILAVLVLLTVIIRETDRQWFFQSDRLYRYAVSGMAVLTFLLNTYALAAILYRMVSYGLTPNRYACLGWNAVTLIILAGLIVTLLKNRAGDWSRSFQRNISRFTIFAVVWALWVVFVLPLSF